MSLHFWENIITPPLAGRTEKPRVSGLTMVIDKGLTLAQTRDWLSLAFPYVDLVKFTFGTPVLYPEEILKPKIDFLRKQGINVFPGGTLLEVAVLQNKTGPFFEFVYQLGFNFLEISDGSITMEKTVRGKLISEGRDRKSTRLNSSHVRISYAVFCLKKKKRTVFAALRT